MSIYVTTKQLDEDASSSRIAESGCEARVLTLVPLGRALRLGIIAEGVETDARRFTLVAVGAPRSRTASSRAPSALTVSGVSWTRVNETVSPPTPS